jgi:hypothetical protein
MQVISNILLDAAANICFYVSACSDFSITSYLVLVFSIFAFLSIPLPSLHRVSTYRCQGIRLRGNNNLFASWLVPYLDFDNKITIRVLFERVPIYSTYSNQE